MAKEKYDRAPYGIKLSERIRENKWRFSVVTAEVWEIFHGYTKRHKGLNLSKGSYVTLRIGSETFIVCAPGVRNDNRDIEILEQGDIIKARLHFAMCKSRGVWVAGLDGMPKILHREDNDLSTERVEAKPKSNRATWTEKVDQRGILEVVDNGTLYRLHSRAPDRLIGEWQIQSVLEAWDYGDYPVKRVYKEGEHNGT